jgi:hypothetical protein
MAIVPIEIKGKLNTKNVQPLSSFTLYVFENGITIHKHQNNNVTTVNGKNAFLALIESYITQNGNGPNGTITSSSITVNSPNGDIDIDILGEGDNACLHFAGAFITQETWDEQKNNVIAMRFLSEDCEINTCETCEDLSLIYCDGNIQFNIPVVDGTYTVVLVDHNTNRTYSQVITSSGEILEWDITNNQDIFMPFTYYTLTLLDENDDVVSWVNNNLEYSCIRIEFVYSTNTNND